MTSTSEEIKKKLKLLDLMKEEGISNIKEFDRYIEYAVARALKEKNGKT